MGDCFARYDFLDHSYDTDERFQSICKQLCAHNMWIRSVLIFAPKQKVDDVFYDKLIVTCGDDETLKLWNIPEGKNISKFRLGFMMNCLEELNYTENDVEKQHFIIGGEQGKLIVYDYATNTVLKDLVGSNRNILCIKVLPNKKNPTSKHSIIVTSNSRGEVRFWDWQKGLTIHRIRHGIQPVQGLCVWEHLPFGQSTPFRMIVNSYEHKVNVWSPGSKSIRKIKQFAEHTNWVRSVVCRTVQDTRSQNEVRMPTASMLVSAGDDNTIRFFNIRNGNCLRILQTHSSGIIYMEMFKNNLISCESCGRIAVTQLEDMKTYYIATGLSFDYYKGLSVKQDEDKNEAYLGVVGSSPKRSSYHFLNIYRGKVVGQNMVFDVPQG